MAVGDVYRLSIVVKSDSSPYVAINQPHYRQMDTLVLDTPEEDLVAAWRDKVEVFYLACFTSALRIYRYEVSAAPDFNTSYVLDLGIGGPVGSLGNDALPPRTSACVSFYSAQVGRRGRGRMFLPPASEVENGQGAPSATYRGYLEAFGQAARDSLSTHLDPNYGHWQMSIWSRTNAAAYDVIRYRVRGSWASQRDRTRIFAAG